MDKFRRLLLSMLFVLIVFSGFVLSACGANDDNMDIKLSATNIQIVLGENDNTATLTATVTDAKTLDVIVDYDSLDIKVTAVYKENGVTNITVVAYRQCTDVEVTVKGAKKSVSFFVTATTPISSLSAKKDIHYIAYDPNAAAVGGQFFLTQDLVQVYPQDTKQTEVRFSLPNPYLGISIENGNILTIAKGLVSVPNTIDVDAVSVYNETVKASLHFEVVKAIDINQISILDGNTLSEAFSEYEINRTTRSVSLQVVIPFSVHTKELDVKPIFKYNDTGIGWDTKSVEKDSVESVYRYTFEFNFTNVSTPNTVTVEEVWFQISYFEYPEIKTSTLNLMDEDVCKGIFKITKVNEITGIASYVEGVVSSAESLDVYTTYKNMSNGLEIQFETIPTNATARQLNLKIDTGNPNFSFLKVMDSSGKNIEFFGGKHTFMAGEKFYFKAQSGFAENASVDITVESTENPDITRQIKIYLQEGVTAFGFKEGDDLVETHTYYLENDAMSEFFSRTLTFGYSPISVKPEKFTVVVEGDVFESDGVIEKNLVFNTPDVVYYDFTINAIAGKSGQGTLKIKFQSGQEISAKIIVIQKLTDVKIDVDTSLSISSAIGDIAYTDDSLSYVAIKNGQSLPIKFTANAKVLTQTYTFSEIVYLPGFNVYDETGEYGSFDNDNLFNLLGNPRTYVETSNIVRPDLLRTTQTISPTEIGKVWIKISFRGECLKEDYKYSIEEVAKYVCVEIYNPVESIDITSPKNISIYAADEVGKVNAHLSKQYITIELNKNSAYKPTYDKILWSKELITDGNPYKYIAVGTDIEILRIERIENTKYLLTVHTTTIPEQSPITFYSIDVTAPDITGESVYGSTTINISINTVKLVSSITPTNVPAYEDKVICQDCHKLLPIGQATCDVCGNTVESLNNYYIYLKTENISTNLADNKFRILTNVLPDDALNQNVVYEFIPDAGTNPNIIHISADGLVSVNDVVGGSGIIRILPQDALLEDETGRQYYREGAPMALIRVVVADGASRETAILVSSLSEIKNAELHYMLQYGTYETHEFLFDSFSGGLYGTNEFSTNKAVIKLTNTSLFNTISLGAVVENIIICGTATAESVSVNGVSTLVGGLLAKVNNGTVENVEVDLINDNTVSSVTGTATNQYLGGLIGVNYGIIQGSTFAGSVGTAGVVGGLVGANYGTIKQSNVLIYNFKTGASEPKMELSGNAVGGIAGEILGTSTIEQCYVFNFGTENSMSSFAGGALVGKISSKKALVKECFAQIGTTSQFYTSKDASVADSDLKSIIKNSYILIKNGENYSFAYYMTQKNGGYIQGISTETNMLYQNVNFGSNYTWNVSDDINHGYPYLTQVRPVAQITDFSNVKIQKTALSLEEVNKTAVMYLYKEKDMVLTEMESNLLNVANTISLEKLFGLTSAGGVRVTSSNENIISTAVNSITVKNTGVVTLTISSKFDRSIESKEVTVCVLYYTSNLSLTVGSTTIGSDTILHIKANTSQKITSSLKNTVVLLNREIPIMENNYLVNFYQGTEKSAYVVGDRIGTHIISATFDAIDDKIELNVFLSLNLESYTFNNIDTRDTVQEIIKANSLKRIYAQKYYGPNKVTTTIKKATISASDSLVFEVVVNSDNVDETVSHIIFDENNDVVTDLFNVEYTQLTVGLSDTKHSVSITIKRESMKNIKAGDYKFRFVTTVPDVYADVTVTVIAQEVIRVDVNNYAQSGTLAGGTIYNYYPSNVISPNSTSLLDITVYPAYAEYTHMTVTSNPVHNEKLTLVSMRKGSKAGESASAYYVDSANNSEFIENGVKIFKKITDDEIARYYVRVVASSAILVDSSYDIYVNVYNGEELVYTIVYNLVVMPQEKPGLSVNGETRIFALLGEEITVDIIKAKEQTLKPNYYISDNRGATVVFNNDWENISVKYEKATFTLYISDAIITEFIFEVQTSMFVNGKEEITSSNILVYIIPFKLDITNTHIKNAGGTDVARGDTYFNHELDFAFAGEYTKAGEDAFSDFANQGYYVGDDYVVNSEAKLDENPYKYGLYYVTNNNEYTAVTNANKPDSIVSISFERGEDGKERIFFLGNMLGKQKMLLEVKVKMPDGTAYIYKYFFTIEIKAELNDDEPTQINSTEEFLKMFENQEEDHYILMKDIELYEYSPASDTSKILSFDGNGFTISIMSYNYDKVKTESTNFALFETIHENTTIKNLRLNVYNINEIALQSSLTSNVNIATVAVNNNGIITNAEVVSYRSNRASDVIPAISGMNITIDSTINVTAKTAGFVINNYGVITNSRVGGEQTVEYTVNKTYGTVSTKAVDLTPFVINSFGEIAGFVHSNTGHITSSFASNLRIVNNSNIDYATLTAGFAINNQGIISMSYAKGVKVNQDDIHADRYGIETTGIAAGFVYANAGTVSDCYSNITLANVNNPGRASAGFVYINKEEALIERSLSLSRIVGSTTTQMNFVGVNEWGSYQNNGTVENSYYYDEVAMEDDAILVEKAYGESARQVGVVTIEDYFYGFNFVTSFGNGEDGIWKMTASGPDLVSANIRTVSLRYTSPNDKSEKPKTTYVDSYRYGSKYNPILIRSAAEFNEVFAGTANKSSSLFVSLETKEVFGNYRIIKDIDLQDLAAEADTYRLASSQMELTGKKSSEGSKEAIGKLDGNGFTIKGFALGDTYSSQNVENFGMFAKMSEGATVMNLNIVIGATNKEGEIFGVEAKNITNVGAIAGTVINSKIVNVNLTSLYEGTNSVTVRGKNIVGGLVGKVKGDSYISNIVVTDVSVTAVNYPENYKAGGLSYESFNSYSRINDDLNKTVSYAGGIIGVFDAYTASTQNTQTFSDAVVSSNTNGIMLKTKGAMQITGATVGGIVGYVGPLTIIQDALFDLAYVDDDSTQGLYSYNGFAGGIVGYNLGYLRQVRAEHNNTKPLTEYDGLTYQELIELGISSYYKPENLEAENSAIEVGNEVLFHHDKYYPIAIGGLVGMQRSGKIEKSYSKINVKTTNGYTGEGYAGGIIGAIEKIKEGEVSAVLHEVYATGDVRQAKYAGGIVGYIQDDSLSDPTKFEKVNALNYWGKWIFENKTMRVYAFAYTPGEIGAEKDLGGLEKTSARYLFEEFPDKKADLETNFTQQAGRTPKFTEMNEVSVNDNGEMFDQIFKGNDWDSNSWGRDEDELYPHMLFGYHSNVIVIRNQNDIEKLRTTDENTFGNITYVIEPDDSIENIHEGDVHLIGVNKKFAPIVGFSNILRGVDDKHQYGFYFYDKNQTKALFKSTSNATFKDFVIRYNGIKLTNTTSQGAAFVEVANNTEFSNLELSGITVENKNILRSDVGILCAVAKGTTVFSNIDFNNCNINLASSTAGGFNVGMLFGNATLSGGRISNIRFSMCGITTSSATASNINLGEIEKSSNIGTIGGALTYTGDEYAAEGGLMVSISAYEKIDGPSGSEPAIRKFDSTIDLSKATLYGVNVGGAFGSINEIRISGKVNKDPDTMPESKITLSNAIGCDIGGLVGETLNGEINNLSIKPTIKTVTEIVDKNLSNIIYNSNIGGVSGYNSNTKYDNIIVGSYEKVTVDDKAVINRDGEISFNAISKYDGSDNVYANVGALTGFSENASIKEINNVETYIDINLVLNGETGKTNQIRAGGIAGILQNVGMENISTYGDIMVSNITPCDNAKKSYGNLYIAGLVALAKNVDITKGIATGNLKNNVGFELYQGINILQMAGLIAKADGEISLENCVAAGNTYPMYNVTVKEDGEGKLSTEEEISVGFNGSLIDAPKTCTQFMYGGLIADISSKTLTNVNLVSNYSIDSLVNKTDDEFVKGEKDARDYYANAFIGLTKNDENDNIEKVNTSTKNKFAHSYTMVLNNNSIKDSDNVLLSEIIPEIQTIIVGEDVSKLTSGKHDYFIIGSKINYQTNLTEEETEVENKYVYLNETQNQLGKAINLKNAIVVADGSDILFAPENNKLSTFGTIDKNSIVSGVRVLANYTVEKEDGFKEKLKSDNVISGFADVNQGIVYSCVVRGGATNNIIPGTIHSRKNPVSGFVNNNGGLIKDSFVEANMISNETDLLVSAFVRENSGYIVTCYASGSIQSPKANSNRRISAFGPGGVYGCYSIVKIVGDNITDYELVRFVFDVEKTAIVKKSYYDMYAVEASLYWDKNTNFNSEKNYGKTTDQLSATYKDSEAAQTKLNSGEDRVYFGDLKSNINYAYGYGSFYDSFGSAIEYMKHYTGNGGSEEINMYQIPNIGKLNQMCGVEGGTKYYNLVKDIDGSYITNEDEGCKEALRWNSKSISDVVFIGTGISGSANAPTIKNVITQKGGLFDKVENSRIGQINLERFNIRSTKADDSNTKDSIFGILANKSINSTISDIYIEQPVDFLQAISSFGSKVENVKFGFVVGKVGNGKEDSSVISNCNVVLTKTSTVNVLEIPESERNWSIGGTIGVLAGGTATNLKLSDSELYIDFAETDARSNKTYVVGGIVAEQTGGVITKSIFNSKLYAFTNEVNVWSGDLSKPINLYVGGIVGKVEQGMNSYAVEECLTQQVSGISAGNHYSFTTVYAGGISGHGGKILNCKNMASVAAYAVYTYGSSYNSMTERYLSNSYTETLEKASWGYKGWKNSDVDADTRNSSSKGYRYKMFNKGEPGINLNSFTKILYAEIKQDAHAAGIANEYELIENCLNTSKSIKGGTKSETLHSYYHPEKSNDEINKKIWNLNLKVVLMDAYLALYAVGIKTFNPYGIALAIICAAIALQLEYTILKEASETINICAYNMLGNGLTANVNEYINYTNYFVKIDNNLKDGSVYKTENESFLESLLVVIDFYGYYGGNILPYGKPAMVHQGQITKAMVASFASQSLAHIKKTTVGETDYYYAIEGNNNYLEVREIYFDALGLSNVSGATKTNSISKTQVYQTVSIDHDNNTGTPNKNYYSINDNSKIESTDGEKTVYKTVCDEYKLLYADGSLQAEAEQDITDEEIQKNINSNYTITKLTMSSGIFDLDGEDGEVWKEIDGDMVLDNVENEKADLAEFLSGKSGSDKKYVSKVNLSDYTNGVVAFDIYDVAGYNLMREIINSNGSYLDTRENEVVLYPEAVDNYNKLVKMFKGEEGYFFSSFKINIKADIYGVSAQLGTKDIPFVGEIVGSGSKAPKLSGVKNAVSSNYSGLVVFAKDLTIKNLDIQYSDLNYALTEDESRPVYHVAGLVGNLVKDGNLTLQDIKLTYNFKDYYEDMDNDISSLNPIAVGGLVGFADTNSKITLKDNIVINSFNVDLKSEGKTTALYGKGSVEATYDQDGAQTSYIKAVGAYVGSMRNANFEVSNEIKSPLSIDNININVNSTNTIVGGLIGYAGIETYIDDGEHPGSGTISLVNIKMGDSESDRIINVSADASKLPTGSRTVSVGGLIGKINGEYSVGLDKLYINLKQIAANTSKAGTEVVYVGGLFGEVTNLEKIVGLDKAESGDESIELGNPRDMKERLYITAGIGGNEYPEKAYANLFVGNKVVDEARNVVYNAKCYSMTIPSYVKNPLEIVSKNIVENRSTTIYKELKKEGKLQKYLKIDTYEFVPMRDSNLQYAYVNGQEYTVYNYQQEYLVVVIAAEKSTSSFKASDYTDEDLSGFGSEYTETKGKDSYTFIESYFRITINGVMANDNDFNMVRNSKIELVRTNKFNTEKDIYEAYHDKAFPLKNRVSLDVSNKGLYPDPSKVGEYMVKIIINNESENLSGKDDVKIEKVSTANYKSNIEEMLQNSVTYEPKKNVVNLSLSFDNLDENGNGSITRYNKIKMSQTESTVSLDMSWDVVSVSEYLESSPTEGKDINILTFKNIYQVNDVDKNGILSYVTKAKQTKDNVKTENSAQVFMDLGNGVKMPISEKFTTVDNYEMVIRAELSEIFTLNKLGTSGASQEQARILIISQYYQKDGDIEDANYDDIYLIKGDTELTMYYLGNIVYSFNDEYTERNEFFFPIPTSEGLKIREYENNVIPLNLIKDIDVLAGLPDSNIIVNKIYGGIITSATIKLATKEMESKNIEYCIRDKSVEGDADANFQIDKVENKKSTTFDIQVDVTGLNTGLENIAVNLICYQEEGAPSTQGYENVVAAEGLNENTYQVSNLVEDSKHEVYEADNVTLKGYEKHFYLQINGESRLYTFEYNLEKELIGVVEVIELTGQNINYGPDGEVIGYITIENEFENDIMWYKKDFVEDITYYSFTDPNEAGGSPIICSLPGIYNFEYKSGDKTITATINNKEKVGLQKIVFDCETNYFAVKQLIYTQNVMNVDGSFDLYTITEDYLTKLQVKIENSDNLNSAEITFEVDDRETPSMTYVSEATINSYLKTVNLSDVMAYGEEYIIAYLNQAMGTGEKYLRKIDLIEIKMFETFTNPKYIVYQEIQKTENVKVYVYTSGMYEEIKQKGYDNFNDFFKNKPIINVEISEADEDLQETGVEYIRFAYLQGEDTHVAYMEKNISELVGYIITSKDSSESVVLVDYNNSKSVSYNRYYYNNATRLYISAVGFESGMNISKNLFIYETPEDGNWEIYSVTPIDNNTDYSINIKDGKLNKKHYTLKNFYQLSGSIYGEKKELYLFTNSGDSSKIKATIYVYSNDICYTDIYDMEHTINETLVARMDISTTAMSSVTYTSKLVNSYDLEGFNNVITTTKVERSFVNSSGKISIKDIVTSSSQNYDSEGNAQGEAVSASGTITYNLKTTYTENERVIKVGKAVGNDINGAIVAEYQYGKLEDGSTEGIDWSAIYQINGKSLFNIQIVE